MKAFDYEIIAVRVGDYTYDLWGSRFKHKKKRAWGVKDQHRASKFVKGYWHTLDSKWQDIGP